MIDILAGIAIIIQGIGLLSLCRAMFGAQRQIEYLSKRVKHLEELIGESR